MSWAPAQRFGIDGGRLHKDEPANFAILDPEQRWRLLPELLRSKSRNSPFLGRSLRGRVLATVFRGRLVHQAPALTEAITQLGG